MAKSRSKSKPNNHKSNAKASAVPIKHLICDETGEKIFCSTATLKDIQHPPTSQKRKVLVKVPSAKTRQDLYDELALCLEDREARLLPKYGGRPWSVICRVQDNTTKSASPFFRWWRGKLELACLPHLLEKIPDPPSFPGYKQTDYGVVRHKKPSSDDSEGEEEDNEEGEEQYENLTEEEVARMESLVLREISILSQVAWDHRNDHRHGAPLPTISIKWTCPLRQMFTSRKAAWDHALELAKAEQFVDRFLRGLGKTGHQLKPFRPTRAQALQAGKVRFLRDGLWVVGQEQHWQNDRYLAIAQGERKRQERQQQQQEEEAVEEEGAVKRQPTPVVDEHGEPLKKRRKITGPMLYVAVHRLAFREKRLKELQKDVESQPKKLMKKEVLPSDDDPSKDDKNTTINVTATVKVSKTAAKVGMPLEEKKKPAKRNSKNNNNHKLSFTLTDADRELRTLWKKKLSDDERYLWDVRAEASFQRKLDMDDHARWEQAREEQAESDSSEGDESEDDDEAGNSNEEAAKVDGGETDQEMSDPANNESGDGEESETASCVELASNEERQLWETFSEAEMNHWKSRAAKNLQGDKKIAAADPKDSFEAYQRRVYDAVFGMTPAQYEKHAVKSMSASDRRKYLKEARHAEELMAYGMKQLHSPAHALLKKRIEKWVVTGIQCARRRDAKKAAATAPTSEINPLLTDQMVMGKKPNLVQHVEVAPPISSFRMAVDPPAFKPDSEPELKPFFSLSSTSPPAGTSQAITPSAPDPDSKPPAVSFNPVSPSPPLVEPVASQSGVQQPLTLSAQAQPVQSTVALMPVAEIETDMTAKEAPSVAVEQQPLATTEATQDESVTSDGESEEEEEEAPMFIPTEQHCLSEAQVKLCHDASMEHFEAVMRTVKAKDLTRELVDGFDLLRERGRGRYDMELPAFEKGEFAFLNDINKAPWMPIVRQVLGDDVVLIHKGCFLSLPDAANQNYHQDGPHLHKSCQKPCHAVNVFAPLVDMTLRHGPTEFCLGSHVLGQEDWDKRYMQTPISKKGVPIMFDYRLGHRGLANTSKEARPVVYCTYARAGDGKEFRDSVNFSRKRYRKLGDLVDKPLSREARKQRREAW